MAKTYRLTPRRKIALRKAQLVSARKRKGKGLSSRTKRNIAIGVTGVTTAVILGGAAYGRHKLSGSQIVYVNGKREPTPMITIAGVEVPGTRAGIRIARYKGSRQGFSVNLSSRNSSGDKLLLSYRHRQLTKGTIQAAIFGKKPWGYGALKKGWTPTRAKPEKIDMDIIDSYPYRTGGRRNSWQYGAFTRDERARRATQKTISVAKKQNETPIVRKFLIDRKIVTAISGGRIDGEEVRARSRDYQRQLNARGIIVNREHISKVERRLRKQTY